MKKSIFLLSCLFIVNCLYSQDIAPSSQAQGYLENKNVTVDYTTGIFHYDIPIYEFREGDFSLPIGLHYTSKGVSYRQKAGLIGYNWTLQAGGVVTRTIRGGIEDEAISNGWANTTYSIDSIRFVNNRLRDGEADIFTVNFNGKSVRFIITRKEFCKFNVIPLEKTSVKVEYIPGDQRNLIDGWIVTDDDGVRYIFKEKEWIGNVWNQAPSSYSSMIDKAYISSWYLTEICIPGQNTIRFFYDDPYKNWQELDGIEEEAPYYPYQEELFYTYGYPIEDHPFDFSKYCSEFDNCLNVAKNYLVHEGLLLQLDLINSISSKFSYIYNFPLMNKGVINELKINNVVCGIISEFDNIENASQELIDALNDLINAVNPENPAKSYLIGAKEIVKRCLREKIFINKKTVTMSYCFQVFSPLLVKISNGINNLVLSYTKGLPFEGYTLNSLGLNDDFGNKKFTVVLEREGANFLNAVYWQRKDNQIDSRQLFKYYYERQGLGGENQWGGPVISYKAAALQEIMMPMGGKICLDYENNRFIYNNDLTYPAIYKGIRLKNIILQDTLRKSDTIRYHYPYGGILMYRSVSDVDTLIYPSNVKDFVQSTQMHNVGNFLFEIGNYGLFYPYVEEEFVGKGINTYLNSTPLQYNKSDNLAIPYWYCGLPLASASYDKNGNLVKMVKNKYYSKETLPYQSIVFNDWIYMPSMWFEEGPVGFSYTQYFKQVTPSKYFADGQKLKEIYKSANPIRIYSDNSEVYNILPGSVYHTNLLPRVNYKAPDQIYGFLYGGKTVLKERKEYIFTGEISTAPSINHLVSNLPANNMLKSHVEFFYDNHRAHSFPTRSVEHKNDGEMVITQRRTPLDFVDGIPVLDSMKLLNMISPVIKEQKLIQKGNDIRLLAETVQNYKSINNSIIFPANIDVYMPEEVISLQIGGIDNCLYSENVSDYKTNENYSYMNIGNEYLLTTRSNLTDTLQIYYDSFQHLPILNVSSSNRDVSAIEAPYEMEFYKIAIPADKRAMMQYFIEHHQYFIDFLKLHRAIDPKEFSQLFQDFYNSESYQCIVKFSTLLTRHVDYALLYPLLDSVYNSAGFMADLGYFYRQELYHLGVSCYLENFDVVLTFYSTYLKSNPQMYDYFPRGCKEFSKKIKVVPTDVNCKKFKVYYVVNSQEGVTTFIPNIYVKTGGVSQLGVSTPIIPGRWQVVVIDVNLSEFPGVQELSADVFIPNVSVALAMIVPENYTFEACALQGDGLPFCKLTHNGRMEYYEYDSAGRVLKVTDQAGNILLENKYNQIF